MKSAPFLLYSVLRLLAFLVPLAILWYFFPIFRELWWLAAIFAALIGVSISMLFLRAPLSDASAQIYERRKMRASAGQQDADAEDEAIDNDPEGDSAVDSASEEHAVSEEDTAPEERGEDAEA